MDTASPRRQAQPKAAYDWLLSQPSGTHVLATIMMGTADHLRTKHNVEPEGGPKTPAAIRQHLNLHATECGLSEVN